jgi:hypothetical protein
MIDTLTLVPLYHYSEFVSCRAAEENRGEQRILCIFAIDIYHVQEHWN